VRAGPTIERPHASSREDSVSTAGYSGTPTARKLGIGAGSVVAIVNDPGDAVALLAPLPDGVSTTTDVAAADVTLFFTSARSELAARIEELGRAVFPDRPLWIAWPKRSSGVATDMTEDAVRDAALPLGLVDNKVCAIDGTWSGLRLVWRRERRVASGSRDDVDRSRPDDQDRHEREQ
jgi:hypothetical protein